MYIVLAGFGFVFAGFAAIHAILYKRDSRAAAGWLGLICLAPFFGPLLYFLFGVNRIERRARVLRSEVHRQRPVNPGELAGQASVHESGEFPATLDPALRRIVDRLVIEPLVPGNRLTPLFGGDEAFPAMLSAIAQARVSVALSTFIFDRDEAGLAFAEALGEAVRRGVAVRVLIDATGTRYSWPSILGELRARGVQFARFLPAFPLWRLVSINLRNHRKILVVDGCVGFTGGMNIRVGHWLSKEPRHPVADLHFRVDGPVVGQMQRVFAEDWYFITGEHLEGASWWPSLAAAGSAWARGIGDGPDEQVDPLRWTLLGATAAARRSIRVMTPYFLPDAPLVAALNTARLRGVKVEILLPDRNNLPLVHAASRAGWWQLLEHHCRIWLTPPPFDHTKLLVVDEAWILVGSANWDPRSLRLNFEFDLECYDEELARRMVDHFEHCKASGREITLAETDGRAWLTRFFDGIARLFSPFL